jgi:hypothetical protein
MPRTVAKTYVLNGTSVTPAPKLTTKGREDRCQPKRQQIVEAVAGKPVLHSLHAFGGFLLHPALQQVPSRKGRPR